MPAREDDERVGGRRFWNAMDAAQSWSRAGGERLSQAYRGLSEEADRFVHDPEVRARVAEAANVARKSVEKAASDTAGAVTDRPGQAIGTGVGAALGICAGVALGAGGVGIVALGGAIGVPLIALTAACGAFAGERIGRESDFVRKQAKAAEERIRHGMEREGQTNIGRIIDKDHTLIFKEAIRDAQRFLCIRSGFISDLVVDQAFVESLDDLINKGVRVYIEYGRRGPAEIGYYQEAHRRAEANLRLLRGRALSNGKSDRLLIAATWTHVKEIAVDDAYIVTGSYNWLSNARASRRETSFRINDPDLTTQVREATWESIKSGRSV